MKYSLDNPHGWGIGYFDKDQKPHLIRSPTIALEDPLYLQTAESAKSNIIIAHIRKKSRGKRCMNNCHPFLHESLNNNWIFAHNGTLGGFPRHDRSAGGTDSEQVFHYLLDQMEHYRQTGSFRGVYFGLQYGIKKVFEISDPGTIKLNFLLSDGVILYAFNHYKKKPMYILKRSKEHGDAFLISTRKLSEEHWEKLPRDKLLAVCNGKILALSKRFG